MRPNQVQTICHYSIKEVENTSWGYLIGLHATFKNSNAHHNAVYKKGNFIDKEAVLHTHQLGKHHQWRSKTLKQDKARYVGSKPFSWHLVGVSQETTYNNMSPGGGVSIPSSSNGTKTQRAELEELCFS